MDGVVNSRLWLTFLTTAKGKLYTKDIQQKTKQRDLLFYSRQIDPDCAKLVAQLIKETDAKVVVSSSWRLPVRRFDPTFFYQIFEISGNSLPENCIIGCTPDTTDNCRGQEIQQWLEQSQHLDIKNWIILDDDKDMLPDQPLFKTNSMTGITKSIFEQAKLRLLNKE